MIFSACTVSWFYYLWYEWILNSSANIAEGISRISHVSHQQNESLLEECASGSCQRACSSKVLMPARPPRPQRRADWRATLKPRPPARSLAFKGRIWIIGRQSLHLHQIYKFVSSPPNKAEKIVANCTVIRLFIRLFKAKSKPKLQESQISYQSFNLSILPFRIGKTGNIS